jgi:predicted DNA binding protein
MSVIADFTLSAEEFVLDHSVEEVPDIDLEVERMVAHSEEGLTPYFRVVSPEETIESFEAALEEDRTVTDLVTLESFEDERFYRAHWRDGIEDLMGALRETEGSVLYAVFEEGAWELRMLFTDRDSLSSFYELVDEDLSLDLVRVFERSNTATYGEFELTDEQRDALVHAFEMDYFAVPKGATIEEVAASLGISPQAVSQRLRRGHANLIESALRVREKDAE